ncbi:MAG TPA: DUF2905 domain-containing protein [Opitutaceae bacterium]|nr:DUF2905 domain-containing protein [Opitutaceae bacterium]
MNPMGKSIFLLGLAIAAVGLLLWSGFGRGWIGRLPGDFRYAKGNVSFYFPLASCLLASLALSLLLWLFHGRR